MQNSRSFIFMRKYELLQNKNAICIIVTMKAKERASIE